MPGFLLVSSNGKSSSNNSEAVGKCFQPLRDEILQTHKATSLSLELDIINLQDQYKNWKQSLKVCESTTHKKDSLKKKSDIQDEIKEFYKTNSFPSFYYSGHGYANGDLCIETEEDSKQGQRLTIQKILDIIIECKNENRIQVDHTWIYLDSCYSGRNAEKARKYLLSKKYIGFVQIYCSSGPNYTSIVTTAGSLLIARECQQSNSMIKERREQLRKKFVDKKPIVMTYEYNNSMIEPSAQICDLDFD